MKQLPKWARIRQLIDGRFVPEIKTGIWPFRSWKGVQSNSSYTYGTCELKYCLVRTEAEAEVALASWGVETSEATNPEPLAFITGSQAYGAPGPDSDVDLVILCDRATHDKLMELSDSKRIPIRYGKLNLIPLTTIEEYTAWKTARQILCNRQDSSKADRIEVHQQCLESAGVAHRNFSGDE